MIVDVAAATTLNRLTHAAVVIVFYHCVAASCVHLIQLLHYIQSIILKSLLFFFLLALLNTKDIVYKQLALSPHSPFHLQCAALQVAIIWMWIGTVMRVNGARGYTHYLLFWAILYGLGYSCFCILNSQTLLLMSCPKLIFSFIDGSWAPPDGGTLLVKWFKSFWINAIAASAVWWLMVITQRIIH